jgi:hypothetical protein
MNIIEPVTDLAAPKLWVWVGILIIGMLVYISFLEYRINSLKTDVAEQTLAASVYANAIEISNTSIAQLKKDSDTAKAQGLKALKEAQKQTVASNKKFIDAQALIDNAKTCEESVAVAKELL